MAGRKDDRNVPYAAIAKALAEAKEKYPEATKVTPCFNAGRVFVEVWYADGHADVIKWYDHVI